MVKYLPLNLMFKERKKFYREVKKINICLALPCFQAGNLLHVPQTPSGGTLLYSLKDSVIHCFLEKNIAENCQEVERETACIHGIVILLLFLLRVWRNWMELSLAFLKGYELL